MTSPLIVTLWRCRIETSAEGVLEQRLYGLLCEDWTGRYVVSVETPRETREACGLYFTGPFLPGKGPYIDKADRIAERYGLSPVEAVEYEQRWWENVEKPRRFAAYIEATNAVALCDVYRHRYEQQRREAVDTANAAKGWT